MKIFTNKRFKEILEWTRAEAIVNYKIKALKLDYIGNLFCKDFSEMSPEEIKDFFHFCSGDTRMYHFSRGMEVGVNSIIDTFEKCGLARKHTLEKLRFRANRTINNNMEKHKQELKNKENHE